jgi:DNA-binding HxlR family transcriptional regulator
MTPPLIALTPPTPEELATGAPAGKCAVETTLRIIGGKWKPMILYRLLGGEMRFNALHRSLPNVTRRMLTEHLRELEADGIIRREVFAQVPPKVVYSLTPLGHTLRPVLDQILTWGLAYQAQQADMQAERQAGD